MQLHLKDRAIARFLYLCTLVLLTASICKTQEPHHIKRVDFALYAADTTIRSLDLVSTHALLSSPCKCFYEADPFAPGSSNLMPLAAFQYGMTAAVIVGHRQLARHHHPRLALMLIVADIVSETWAVQGNFRQKEPVRLPTGFVPAP